MKEPSVSIIIINWNGKDDTLECLESLSGIRYKNFDVIVVDNGSTDGSQEIIRNNYPRVKLIQNDENKGFSEANNIGASYSNADYYLFLNNDTTVDKNLLKELVRAGEEDPMIGALCPKIYMYSKKDHFWYAGAIFKRHSTVHRGFNKKDVGQYDEIEDTGFLSGCAFFIKKSVADKVGLFDEQLFIYLEDVDLSIRIQKAGYRTVYVPEAVLWHKESASTKKMSEFFRYLGERNIMIIAMKHRLNMPIFLFLDLLHVLKLSMVLLMKGRFKELRGCYRAKWWFVKKYFLKGGLDPKDDIRRFQAGDF